MSTPSMDTPSVITPIYQRPIEWALYLLTGAVALGVLLDAVSNSIAIITPVVTYAATAAGVVLWALVEVLMRKGLIRWNTGKTSPRFLGLKAKPRLAVAGAILLLWVPRLIPSPASPETLRRLNAELLDAAAKGAETGIRQALDEGADIDGRDPYGLTALMKASLGEQPRTDSPNHFPYPGAVKLLVERGADVNLKDDNGNTALIYAAGYVCNLDNKNADVAAFLAPQIEATRQRIGEGIGAIETLCGRGAEVNAVNNLGNTALMVVAASRIDLFMVQLAPDRRIAETLIRCGAKTDLKNGEGKTALKLAEDFRNLEIANVLREAGAKE